MFCAVNTFPPFMLGCSVHNAYSVTHCATLRHCSQFKEITRKKKKKTFGWGFLTRIKAAQRLNGHFMSLGVHLVLTSTSINWKWAVLQLPHRLIPNCFPGAICSPNVISTERYCYKLLRCLSAACSLASVYLQFT